MKSIIGVLVIMSLGACGDADNVVKATNTTLPAITCTGTAFTVKDGKITGDYKSLIAVKFSEYTTGKAIDANLENVQEDYYVITIKDYMVEKGDVYIPVNDPETKKATCVINESRHRCSGEIYNFTVESGEIRITDSIGTIDSQDAVLDAESMITVDANVTYQKISLENFKISEQFKRYIPVESCVKEGGSASSNVATSSTTTENNDETVEKDGSSVFSNEIGGLNKDVFPIDIGTGYKNEYGSTFNDEESKKAVKVIQSRFNTCRLKVPALKNVPKIKVDGLYGVKTAALIGRICKEAKINNDGRILTHEDWIKLYDFCTSQK